MTKEQAKVAAIAARHRQIEQVVNNAATDGNYEVRVDSLLPEQMDWLKEKGYTLRPTVTKQGTSYDIIWS